MYNNIYSSVNEVTGKTPIEKLQNVERATLYKMDYLEKTEFCGQLSSIV